MLLMPTKALKRGMVIAQPIFHPRQDDIVLLQAGFVLDAEYISRLRELDIKSVWVEFEGLEEIDGKINPRIAAGHMALYQAVQESLVELRGRVAVEMNLHRYRVAIEQILLDIVDDPDHEVLINQLQSASMQAAGHLANCCYLSLLVGAHMSGYLRQQRRALPVHVAEDTHRLGIGALLHDIGKLGMPPELQDVCILDEGAEWPEYRAHAQAGFERVQGHIPGAAANIILHHHQRYDGTGFPDRFDRVSRTFRPPPAQDQIHVFARIVGLIDTFDHLLHRNDRPVPTIIAMYVLQTRYGTWFDPVIVETLARLIPPFMVGSMVELSNGKHAVVIENHIEAPCRPTVRLLSESIYGARAQVEGPPVDLRLCREPCIYKASGVDVRPYLFEGKACSGIPMSAAR